MIFVDCFETCFPDKAPRPLHMKRMGVDESSFFGKAKIEANLFPRR